MSFNPAQAIAYYQNQLIIQYNGLPNASGTIAALVNCSICDNFYAQLQSCFNINAALGTIAVGQQLTIIGKIIGVPRNVYGLDLVDTFFTLSNWTGRPASVGFNTWSNATPDSDKISSWLTTAVYTPTDFEMLALIQLKIIKNTFYTSLGQIDPILYEYFNGAITLTDNLNTSITWSFAQPYHNVGSICQFLGNIVPKPMGVAINYVLI